MSSAEVATHIRRDQSIACLDQMFGMSAKQVSVSQMIVQWNQGFSTQADPPQWILNTESKKLLASWAEDGTTVSHPIQLSQADEH